MPYLSYKYRIYPNKQQQEVFGKTFDCVRLVYNRCLQIERDTQNLGDSPLSQKELLSYLSVVLLNEYPFLKNVNFNPLCHAIFHLFRTYQRYWDKKGNPPAFKTRKLSKNTFTTSSGCEHLEVGQKYIIMPTVGKVKARIHRPLPEFSKILSFTIVQESDSTIYCSVLFSYSQGYPARRMCNTRNSIGLDYRAKGLFTDSNGNECDAPRYNLEAERKLKRAHRRLDRMIGGTKGITPSKNYMKQRKKLNKIYRKTVNRRNDYLHKKSAELVSKYDIICVEDLNMNKMAARGQGFSKSTMDNAYGRFLELLSYKAHAKGKYLVKVGRWFPSTQLCCRCGYQQKLDIGQRVFNCPKCGLTIDRDYNAAINIRREGIRILTRGAIR